MLLPCALTTPRNPGCRAGQLQPRGHGRGQGGAVAGRARRPDCGQTKLRGRPGRAGRQEVPGRRQEVQRGAHASDVTPEPLGPQTRGQTLCLVEYEQPAWKKQGRLKVRALGGGTQTALCQRDVAELGTGLCAGVLVLICCARRCCCIRHVTKSKGAAAAADTTGETHH